MLTVAPSTSFEARAEAFPTGLAGTIGVQILDNAGGTTLARTTAGITENPAGSGSYIVTLASPAASGQYSLFWDTGVISPSTTASEDLVISSTAPIPGVVGDTYASASELARILKIRTPTADQTIGMERALLAAAGEINSEIDLPADADDLAGWQLALIAEVNLERAVEHWRQQESPFGLLAIGVDIPAERTAQNSWNRHAEKLAPLKGQWGFA